MKTILTAIIICISNLIFSQEIIVGNIDGKSLKIRFKKDYAFAQIVLNGEESVWHKVFDLEEFEYQKETCHSFSYISSSGIVHIVFCRDGSLAIKLPSGDILEGEFYYIKENRL